jgi:hypothetical protein
MIAKKNYSSTCIIKYFFFFQMIELELSDAISFAPILKIKKITYY